MIPPAVPASARIDVVPFLVAGHRCSFTVVGEDGRALKNAGVYLDDELFCSDSGGKVTVAVPDSQSFELSLRGEGGHKTDKHIFLRGIDKVYAEQSMVADGAASLLKTGIDDGAMPLIVYAPLVLSPGETFVIVGRNFSANISDDYVDIDGTSSRILSATPDSLLVQASGKLSLGPLRELFLTVKGQASNSAELDIAKPFFTHMKTEPDDVSPEKGKIGMSGTDAPCLVQVRNNDTEIVSLWSPTQEPLGKINVMLSPGGDKNYLNIDVRLLQETEPKIELALLQEFSPLGGFAQLPPQLLLSLCRAEIMRLERRRIATAFRLDQLSKASVAANEQDKLSERKALSTRLLRASSMLAARKALYESLGGTDAQYRQALDDAAGGALFTLDQSVKPIQIVSEGGVAGAAAATVGKPQNAKKGRLLRMLEPPIHLLPPMSDAQQLIMNEKNSSAKAPATQLTTPALRPGLPEPEPEVSAASRGARPDLAKPSEHEKKDKKASEPAIKSSPKTGIKEKSASEKSAGTKAGAKSAKSASASKKATTAPRSSGNTVHKTSKRSKGGTTSRRRSRSHRRRR